MYEALIAKIDMLKDPNSNLQNHQVDQVFNEIQLKKHVTVKLKQSNIEQNKKMIEVLKSSFGKDKPPKPLHSRSLTVSNMKAKEIPSEMQTPKGKEELDQYDIDNLNELRIEEITPQQDDFKLEMTPDLMSLNELRSTIDDGPGK